MIYPLKIAEQQHKNAEHSESAENVASLNKVESLVEHRKNISQKKARQKVLLASSKINW